MTPLALVPSAFLALALSAGAPTAVQPTGGEAEATPLERALESITPENIKSDLYFIASDEMAGRDTPSKGQRIAARFIRSRLQRLGWEAGTADGYFHNYELSKTVIDEAATKSSIQAGDKHLPLTFGSDYAFSMRGGALEAKGDMIFAGTLADEEMQDIDVEGKWLVVRQAEKSTWPLMRKAREKKALGLVFVPGEARDAAAMQAECESLAVSARKGRVGRGGGSSRRAPFPLAFMTEAGFQRVQELGGSTGLEIGKSLGVELHDVRAVDDTQKEELENVCGIWRGSDPLLSNEVIILSAHYDHVGVSSNGDVFNGADDNGSGTCGLLAVAEAITNYGPMSRTVMLIWVSGEEKGLLGSRAWTENPWLPEGMKAVCNINIDMIGRNAGDSLLITPTSEHDAYNGLTRVAEKHCESEGFAELGSADAYWGRSDHANFSKNMEIPVAFLFSDIHEDYHKVTDTPDKIDYDKISRVTRLVVRMLDDLQSETLDL
jgi:hypothetical protein